MRMLSLFPQILFLSPFAPFLIRIALAILFGYAAWRHAYLPGVMPRVIAGIATVLAVGFFIGAWTQAAALLGACMLAASIISRRPALYPVSTRLLALVMCLCLLVTGAGVFAFDLPL
jgi:hypothetical protein